jgi:hypothetical protein
MTVLWAGLAENDKKVTGSRDDKGEGNVGKSEVQPSSSHISEDDRFFLWGKMQ